MVYFATVITLAVLHRKLLSQVFSVALQNILYLPLYDIYCLYVVCALL
jgi:hypothetical protein